MIDIYENTIKKTPKNLRRLEYILRLKGKYLPENLKAIADTPTVTKEDFNDFMYDVGQKTIDIVNYINDFNGRSLLIENGTSKSNLISLAFVYYKKCNKILIVAKRANYDKWLNLTRSMFDKVYITDKDSNFIPKHNRDYFVNLIPSDANIVIVPPDYAKREDILKSFKAEMVIIDMEHEYHKFISTCMMAKETKYAIFILSTTKNKFDENSIDYDDNMIDEIANMLSILRYNKNIANRDYTLIGKWRSRKQNSIGYTFSIYNVLDALGANTELFTRGDNHTPINL